MSKFSTAKQFINQIFGGSVKTTGTEAINKVDIAKNLTKRFNTKQAGFKSVDDQTKGTNVDISKKSKIKKEFSKAVSDAYDKFEGATKKAKGGRVGYKKGTGLIPKKKSNVIRKYSKKDIDLLKKIYHLLKVEKLKIEGAKKNLKNDSK